MFRLTFRPLHLLALLSLAPGSQAAPPSDEPLTPVDKWLVDFADAHCLASLRYGTGDEAMALLLKPSPLGNIMQVAVVRPGWRPAATQVKVRISFDVQAPIETRGLVYGTPGPNKQIVHQVNLSMEQFAAFRGSTQMRLAMLGVPDRPLVLNQTKAVATTIEKCLKGLQADWNIGGDAAMKIKDLATPKQPLTSYISHNDYPKLSSDKGEGGTTSFVMLIDEKGAVADCSVYATSGFPALDAQSCAVFRNRAKFNPALDVDGKAVRSTWGTTIKWVIPAPGT